MRDLVLPDLTFRLSAMNLLASLTMIEDSLLLKQLQGDLCHYGFQLPALRLIQTFYLFGGRNLCFKVWAEGRL